MEWSLSESPLLNHGLFFFRILRIITTSSLSPKILLVEKRIGFLFRDKNFWIGVYDLDGGFPLEVVYNNFVLVGGEKRHGLVCMMFLLAEDHEDLCS